MNRSQRGFALIVGLAGFFSFQFSGGDLGVLLGLTLMITAVLHLLWQTVMATGTVVEPLDFFPGTVLLLCSALIRSRNGDEIEIWPFVIALAVVVGLAVLMRPFGPHLDEEGVVED